MVITSKIQIDLAKRGVTARLDAVQFDSNSRVVEITLYENGAAWEPPEGASAAMAYRKSDGTSGLYDTLPDESAATAISGNVVTVTLAPQILTVAGLVTAAVVLYSGEDQLATFPFHVVVAPNPSAGGGVSNDYYHYQSFGAMNAAIGNLAELLTDDKSSLVAAVNEIHNSRSSVSVERVTVGVGDEIRTGVQITVKKVDGTVDSSTVYDGEPGTAGDSSSIDVEETADGYALNIYNQDGETGAVGVSRVELKHGKSGTGGLDSAAAALLITILRNGVYTTDQSANITALEAALASSESESGGGGEESATDDITVTDGVMTIVSVGSAISVTDDVMIIA